MHAASVISHAQLYILVWLLMWCPSRWSGCHCCCCWLELAIELLRLRVKRIHQTKLCMYSYKMYTECRFKLILWASAWSAGNAWVDRVKDWQVACRGPTKLRHFAVQKVDYLIPPFVFMLKFLICWRPK